MHDGENDYPHLSHYLSTHPNVELDVPWVDGYLTCIAIGPELIMPSQWLPYLQRNDLVWDDLEQAKQIIEELMEGYNAIVDACAQAQPNPLVFTYATAEGDKRRHGVSWCNGFVDAMRLRPDAWETYIFSGRNRPIMAIMALGLPVDEGESQALTDVQQDLAGIHDRTSDLPGNVLKIYKHWRKTPRRPSGSKPRPKAKPARPKKS